MGRHSLDSKKHFEGHVKDSEFLIKLHESTMRYNDYGVKTEIYINRIPFMFYTLG